MKTLFTAGTIVTIGMLAGRALGFIREAVIAAMFGATTEADSAIAMLMLPDMITTALIGTCITSALIPAFARRDVEAAKQLFVQTALLTTIIFSLLALGLIASSGFVFGSWIAADDAVAQEALHLSLLILPISALTGVVSAWLLNNKEFVWFSFATFIFNAVIIAALLFFPTALFTLGIAIVVGALLRLFSQVLSVIWHRIPSAPQKLLPWQLNRGFGKVYVLAMLAGLLGLVPQYAPYWVISTSMVTGDMAIFNYAFKLVLLPALLLQTLIQTVLMPYLAEMVEAKDVVRERTWLRHGFFMGIITAIIGTVLMIAGAHVITELCFGYGVMTPRALQQVGKLVGLGVLLLPGIVVLTLLQSAFYAHHDARTNFIASIVQAVVMLGLCYLCYLPLGSFGVMLGVVVSFYAAILFYVPRMKRLGLAWGELLPADNFVMPVVIMTLLLLPAGWWLLTQDPGVLMGLLVIKLVGIITLALCLVSQREYRAAFAAWRTRKQVPHA